MTNNSEFPLISIIVPVYNMERYLEQCVCSILNQTYANIEIILVNDGSTDRSVQICDEFAKKDSRVVVIHKSNTGQADSRNKALDVCRGEYVGFVDSDDWVEADMYELLYDTLISTKADVSICGVFYEYINRVDTLNDDRTTKTYTSEEATRMIFLDSVIKSYSCDKLFKKEVILRQYPDTRYFEDLSVMIKWIANASLVSVCSVPKYHYRQRCGSIVNVQSVVSYYAYWQELINTFLFVRDRAVFADDEEKIYKKVIKKTLSVCKDIARISDKKTALNYYKQINDELRKHGILRQEYMKGSQKTYYDMLDKRPSMLFFYFKTIKKLHSVYKQIFTTKRIKYV